MLHLNTKFLIHSIVGTSLASSVVARSSSFRCECMSPSGVLCDVPTRCSNLIEKDLGGITAVSLAPHPSSNFAFTGIGETLTNGMASISTQYTTTNSFSLSSFYFGLIVSTTQTVAQVPIKGTVKITGYQAGANNIVEFYLRNCDNASSTGAAGEVIKCP